MIDKIYEKMQSNTNNCKVTHGTLVVAIIAGLCLVSGATMANNDKGQNQNKISPAIFEDASTILHGFTHTNTEHSGDNVSGLAWLDCDNDGDLDLYVTNGIGAHDGLLVNEGGVFTNKTGVSAGDIGDANGSASVASADLNNDGNTDIIVTGEAAFLKGVPSAKQLRIYAGNGDCSFNEVADNDMASVIESKAGAALTVSLADIDNDGLLDVFVTAPSSLTTLELLSNHLFLNQGNFQFLDISATAGDAIYAAGACTSAFTHYDDDGYIDLLVGDCNLKLDRDAYREFLSATGIPEEQFPPFVSTPLRMLRNNGNNSFTLLDVNLPEPPEPIDQQMPPLENGFWMSSTLGDFDADGDFDIFSSSVGEFFSPFEVPFGLEPGTFLQEHYFGRREENGTFKSVAGKLGIEAIATKFSWGGAFADFNNDSWEDLFFAGNIPEIGFQFGNPGYLFTNQRGKKFRLDPIPTDLSLRYSSGVAVGDYDNDGRIDIIISNGRINVPVVLPDVINLQPADDKPVLLHNISDASNNWVTLQLVGTNSNRNGIGAQLKAKSKGVEMLKEIRAGEGFLSTSSPWPTFGLGKNNKRKVKIRVRWPLGLIEEFTVNTRQVEMLVEGTGLMKKHF